MKTLVTLALAAALSSNAFAANEAAPATTIPPTQLASKASIEKMMEVMHLQKMVDTSYTVMEGIIDNLFNDLGASDADESIKQKYSQKMWVVIKQDMNWEKIKGPVEDIYGKYLTENEVQAMTAFYSTPEGQSMLEKMPLIMRDAMAISRTALKDTLPKIQEISQQMLQELQAKKRPAK